MNPDAYIEPGYPNAMPHDLRHDSSRPKQLDQLVQYLAGQRSR